MFCFISHLHWFWLVYVINLENKDKNTQDGGSVFLTTLNRSTRSWLLAILGAEYVLGLLPRGTHDWNKFIKPEELEGWLDSAGIGTRLVNGMIYVPGKFPPKYKKDILLRNKEIME